MLVSADQSQLFMQQQYMMQSQLMHNQQVGWHGFSGGCMALGDWIPGCA
jgi:hypothetical protein